MSVELTKLGPALLAVQKALKAVKKDSTNPHFGNDFASLESVLDTAKPVLNDNGIVLLQLPSPPSYEGYLGLTTILLHAESGESIQSTAMVPLAKDDPQGLGSAITYARRYSILSALGIATQDDDAEAAVGRSKPAQTTAPKTFQGSFAKPGALPTRKPAQAKAPARGKAGVFPKVNSEEEGGSEEEGDGSQED